MNLPRKIFAFFSIACLALLCGCLGDKYYQVVSSQLDDTKWVPIYVLGQEATDVPTIGDSDNEAYLHFVHRGYGHFLFTGKGSVNTLTGSMDVRDDNSIVFAPHASALHVGKNYAYELKFVSALRDAQAVEFEGDYMTLYRKDAMGNKVLLIKLQKVAR